MEDRTMVKNFILVGFSAGSKLQIFIFVVLLIIYISIIIGNLVIVTISIVDRGLHVPMYYFIWNFSLLEIGFTSSVIPKVLFNLASGEKTISVTSCFVQCFLYFVFGMTEFLLLAAMSIDRYVAICYPLSYSTIMSNGLCSLLVLGSWGLSFALLIGPSIVVFQLPFCNQNINHFFCDSAPLVKLSCIETAVLDLVNFSVTVFSLLGTLIITVLSYANIISTILHIPSASGRQKAFSTCASHLIVVFMSYGSCIFIYVKPMHMGELDISKGVAVLNTVVSPLLNPFIFSLRNRQVQEALQKYLSMCNSYRTILSLMTSEK
ncbi:olfactory receptor 6E1-like [Numenius arquata]|uniref:olfactory receptor 6E1-like n=1 Tax=Numenius arquata TaxID=31919 RepID=UPI003D306DCE